MKLWDNGLCPSIILREYNYASIPLSSSYSSYSERKYFHSMLTWLKTVHTDPLMLEFITTFWHGENLVLDPECPQPLKSMYYTLMYIGLHQMWLGLSPVGMVECQANYYL